MAQIVLNSTWLRRQLELKGLSQAEFAGISKVGKSTLTKINKGEGVRPDVARRIAAALNEIADLPEGAVA